MHTYVVKEKIAMSRKYRSTSLVSTLLLCLILQAGCSIIGGRAGNAQNTLIGAKSATATANPTIHHHGPGVDPVVIQSPTSAPSDSPSAQQLGLPDRTIVIESVSEQTASAANFATITLKLTFKNTGSKDINNLATAYQLVGTEGDVFGLQPGSSSDFFGTISAGSTRRGTLVFQQIPSAATRKLQLLYHPGSSQVIFAPLSV